MGKVTVTKKLVEKVKSYQSNDRYSALSHEELALLCGTSSTTFSRIVNGQYDHLINPEPKAVNTQDVNVAIDYDTLKRLMACEYAVNAMLSNAKLSTGYDGALFIDYKVVFGILRAYLPEEAENRLNELREEARNE